MWGISWLAENLSASQAGLYFLISNFRSVLNAVYFRLGDSPVAKTQAGESTLRKYTTGLLLHEASKQAPLHPLPSK
jgi:hypothetical protein